MRLLSILKIDTLRKCSKRIWLLFFAEALIVMVNFNKLEIPESLFVLLLFIVACYSVISLFGYAYWLMGQWCDMTIEARFLKSSYWFVLASISLASVLIFRKMGLIIFR